MYGKRMRLTDQRVRHAAPAPQRISVAIKQSEFPDCILQEDDEIGKQG